ncbi:MAG TPA: ABC transporter permease [Bryobacteraceae bacterium]|nr:ABC transporter permease [Bryobacteraceae bacterium]
MRRLRRGWNRFTGFFMGRRKERELADELAIHILMQTEDNIHSGMSAEEARRSASLKFGSLESTKEDVRSQRSLPELESLLKDVSYALRGLRKNPGFAAAAIVTLALGIGANTAIFDVVHSVLLKPLPYPSAEQLYAVGALVPQMHQLGPLPVPIQSYLQWRNADTAVTSMAAIQPWQGNLTGDGEPENLGGARVSTNFFSVLGVPVAHGRSFIVEEEQPGNDRVVVISHGLWQRRYGGDPSAIGRKVDVNGEGHVIVGIAPPSLLLPTGTQLASRLLFAPHIDIWKPIAPTRDQLRAENWNYAVLARLKPGESPEKARQQLETMLNARMRAQMPNTKVALIVQLTRIRDVYAAKARLPLLLVLAASGLLLMIACTNISNLFFVRAAHRSTELATRVALGAARGRILSHAITESTVLAILGGTLGAVIASYSKRLLIALGPDDVRLLADRGVFVPALLFALAASVMIGVVCGFFPAWQAYKRSISCALQESARTALGGGRAGRVRHILVATQMALATMLLASAGLLLHSFFNVTAADLGYQVERILAVDVALSGPRYSPDASRVAFYRELARSVRELPGVRAAGAISQLPAVSRSSGAQQSVYHDTDTNSESVVLARPMALIRSVTSGYFAASGTALRAGRFFTDHESLPVAVISESLAAHLWRGQSLASILGRSLRHGNVTSKPLLVVGIVQDVRSSGDAREPAPIMYRPDDQWTSGAMSLVIQTDGEPAVLAAAVRAVIRKMDSNLPVTAIRTLREIISESLAQQRFQTILISLFALVALLLGAVGIYGVVSYSVACRTREVGLRIALGAMKGDVVLSIVLAGMKPVLAGLLIGLATAVVVAVTLRSLLYGIAPADPISLGVVAIILLFTSGMACYIPARRASRLDPMLALRH